MGRSPRRDPCNTGEDLRAVNSPKHRATNWLTTATDRNHKKRPPILKSGHRRHATLRAMDTRKSSSLRDRSTEATGTMMNGDCRTNSFRRERTTTGHQATAIFSTRKRRLDKPGPDREGILRQPGTAPPRPPGSRPEIEESQPVCRKQYRCESEGRRGIPE